MRPRRDFRAPSRPISAAHCQYAGSATTSHSSDKSAGLPVAVPEAEGGRLRSLQTELARCSECQQSPPERSESRRPRAAHDTCLYFIQERACRRLTHCDSPRVSACTRPAQVVGAARDVTAALPASLPAGDHGTQCSKAQVSVHKAQSASSGGGGAGGGAREGAGGASEPVQVLGGVLHLRLQTCDTTQR
ncbi:unnamed protein product [Chrysodeixis includens]|uniref:Uncharacterized protein n=1 Tax=Chrysodeixis includens TaxID=689277 RepID=A0A9N8Q0G0_CHRIL|nr:unnamed protein product [Chrysodeixis includens]